MCAMGHGTGDRLLETRDETSPARDAASVGDDRKRWVNGTASLVSLSLAKAVGRSLSSASWDAGETSIALGASRLFYSMREMSGTEDETFPHEIVAAHALNAYLTEDYVRHTRRHEDGARAARSHVIQFLLRRQNRSRSRLTQAALLAQRDASPRRGAPLSKTRPGAA